MNETYPIHYPHRISRIYFLNENELGIEIEVDNTESVFVSMPVEEVKKIVKRLERALASISN